MKITRVHTKEKVMGKCILNHDTITDSVEFDNLLESHGNTDKLAFEAAIGDMGHDPAFEWLDSDLDHGLDQFQ